MVFTSEFFDCHEFCEKSALLNDGKVIFQSDTYTYSHYYHYSELIRRNQTFPNISGNFEKLVTDEKKDVKFPFTFYGAHLDKFSLDTFGVIHLRSQDGTGVIYNNFNCDFWITTETLVGEDYFAVRRSCPTNIDNKIDTIKIMHLIRSNGKISFYYENIPTGLKKDTFASGIGYFTHCGEALKGPEIRVPGEWIQTGTLVEYEVLGNCPNYNSTEACLGGTTSNITCIWCGEANTCITRNDKDVHIFEVNGCQMKRLDVNVPTELTTLATNALKKMNPSTEWHLNITTDTIEDIEKSKSLSYVYIVVPLVISFLILCVGCGIWLWFYRRERVLQWFSQIASQFSSSR